MYDTEGEWENHDIRTAKSYGIPKADLWTGGFPCQDLSIAGKRKGLQEGERSGLFYEIIRLLSGLRQEDRPKWLLLENVKGLFSAGGGFDFLRCIVELGQLGYSVEYQLLNSKDFGVPQNRERVFIVGRLGEGSGGKVFPIRSTDGENTVGLSQIGRLKDSPIENSQTYRVYDTEGLAPTIRCMKGGNLEPLVVDEAAPKAVDVTFKNRTPRITDIAPTLRSPTRGLSVMVEDSPKVIDAIYNNREPRVTDIAPTLRADRQGLCVAAEVKVVGNYSPSGHEASRVLDPSGIAPTVKENHGTVNAVAIDLIENKPKTTTTARCLTAKYTAGITNHSGVNSGVLVKEATKQGYAEAYEGDSINLSQPNSQTRRGRVGKQIANTLTCSDTMGVVVKPIEENVFDIYNNKMCTDGCTGTLTTNGNTSCAKCGTFGVFQSVRIRKLTPRECWRLQGFPDEYFDRAVAAGVSNSQLYKQAGNSVSVPVSQAIGERLREIELCEDISN